MLTNNEILNQVQDDKKMIKALIFDFGDVFINLDKQGTIKKTKELFGYDIITEKKNKNNQAIFKTNDDYEKGLITTEEFVSFYCSFFKNVKPQQVISLWNSLIKDFPKHRLEFIKRLKNEKQFELILLSNTNELHIDYIKQHVSFYEDFKSCFNKFYLSHEIHLRKPNADIFEFVLNESNLKAKDCFFIDDTKQNTEAAERLGIRSWNIDEHSEDVTTLFETYKHLF